MMSATPADPTLDRLLRHMAWANAALFARLAELAARCASRDARIRAQAAVSDGPATYPYRGTVIPARSTIIGQAIHHATEHRAQIAGALATNGIDAIDLDALDVWAYGDAEGLGA